MNSTVKIGFVGLGLIGGSLAKAIKKYFPTYEIVAFDPDNDALLQASQEDIVDIGCKSIGTAFEDCSYIFLCAPVVRNNKLLEQLTPYLNDDCILSDVGSVKSAIHKKVAELGLNRYFIGGHPMTGSERSGYAFSKPTLLENAYYILTPTEETAPEKLERFTRFISELKGLPIVMDCQRHDHATAAISHLPHIIASGLVSYVRENDSEDEIMKRLAAGGFKDLTRIASSNPTMWEDICLMNRDSITETLDHFISLLTDIRDEVSESRGEDLYEFFSRSRNYRDSITDISAGPIRKDYSLYCDLIDEAGGIATLATILATNHINLKNIGIIHNREFEEGVLKVELYDEPSMEKAAELLKKFHYTVYVKS